MKNPSVLAIRCLSLGCRRERIRFALLVALVLLCCKPVLRPETPPGPPVFPEKVGAFVRKEPEFSLGWYRRTGDVLTIPGLGVRPLPPFNDVNATYIAPGGGEVTVGVKQFSSPEEATKALGFLMERDSTPDKKAGPASDLLRCKIVHRTPLPKGIELIVMQNLPKYWKAEEVYWLDGKNVFIALNFKNYGVAEAFAKAFVGNP
jgi:hypothetical protein